MAAVVTSKGQITIPKRIRDVMGIGPGSVVDFGRGDDNRFLVVTVERASDGRFSRFRGHAGKGMSTDEVMALTRGAS
jgi:antitoxin PrlF